MKGNMLLATIANQATTTSCIHIGIYSCQQSPYSLPET